MFLLDSVIITESIDLGAAATLRQTRIKYAAGRGFGPSSQQTGMFEKFTVVCAQHANRSLFSPSHVDKFVAW